MYLSAKKINLEAICLSQKLTTKDLYAHETKSKKTNDFDISAMNKKALHKLVMET